MNKVIHSPFFIFIKCSGVYSDDKIFDFLKIPIKNYFGTTTVNDSEKLFFEDLVYITEDENWIHIMDNYSYHLFLMENLYVNIEKFALKHDIYYCSVGNSDHSYEFVYYKNGIKKREFYVSDIKFGKPKVEKDFGIPFEIEKKFLTKGFYQNSFILSKIYALINKYIVDELEKVLYIAESIGIVINHEKLQIRAYELGVK